MTTLEGRGDLRATGPGREADPTRASARVGRRIDRVVMVTPDTLIDRRILQEAHTLAATGREVILLSFPVEGKPEFERHVQEHVDGSTTEIKIQRVLYQGIEPRFRWMTLSRLGTSWLLGKGHTAALTAGRWMGRGLWFTGALLASPVWGTRRAAGMLFARLDRRGYGRPGLRVRQPVGAVLDGLGRRTSAVAAKLEQLRVRATQKAFHLVARVTDTGFHYAILARARLSGVSSFDHFMRERIAYYRPDIVHAHDLPVLPGAVLAAEQVGAQCVYDAHEIYTEQPFPPRAKRFLTRLETRYVPRTDLGIVVNRFAKVEMETRYAWRRLEVVENAVDRPAGFDAAQRHDRLRAEVGLGPDDRILLFQGWMCAGRNLEALVRAFAHTPEGVHLVLMGYGDYREDLARMAAEAGASARVHFVDAKPQDELLYWTASADVGVMPYTYQGSLNELYSSPNKFYEFVAAGLPILANDLPFYREVLTRHGNGLVAELETPEKIAAAVADVFARDLDELRAKSRQAFEIVNWRVEGEKLVGMYEALEAQRSSGGARSA